MSKSIFYYLKKYSYLLGIFLFIIILAKTDLQAILENLKDAKLTYLILAPLLSFPLILIKSYCWNYIKKKQGINYRLKDSFLMYNAGLYIGGITPGKVGEISRAIYLKKDGYSLGKSLVSLILDRLSDIIFLIIFIILGSFFLFNFSIGKILIFIFLFLIASFLLLIFFKSNLSKITLKKIFYLLIPNKYQKSWMLNFHDFINDIKKFSLKNYLFIFLITVFSWIFYYIQMYFIALSVNINIPLLSLSIILTIIGFITLIPISISGIGTRDVTLIFFLSPFMIETERIIAFSTLVLLIYLFTSLIGLICWLIKPLKIF